MKVTIPDKKLVVNFPDDMAHADIERAIYQHVYDQDVLSQGEGIPFTEKAKNFAQAAIDPWVTTGEEKAFAVDNPPSFSPAPQSPAQVTPAQPEETLFQINAKPEVQTAPSYPKTAYDDLIKSSTDEHGVPYHIGYNLLKAESNFNPDAVSGAGAQGIAQFMPATAAEQGVDPLDPASAIPGSMKYLKKQFDRFGSWDKALAAYNAGAGNVDKYGGVPPFEETQAYVKKIMAGYTPDVVPPQQSAVPVPDTVVPVQGQPQQSLPEPADQIEEDKNLLAYAPYMAIKAIKGIMGPTLGPLKTMGMDTENALNVATEFWKKKLPDVKVPNAGVVIDEAGNLDIQKIDGLTLGEIIGETAEGVGFLAPMSKALEAGGLVASKLSKHARPFYQNILKGMIGGALLGEGDKDKTLENMAMFGVFEGAGYAIGKLPGLVDTLKSSTTYRKASIKERGLVIQNLEQTIKNNPDIAESELVKMSDNYFKEALARRSSGETAPQPRKQTGIKAPAPKQRVGPTEKKIESPEQPTMTMADINRIPDPAVRAFAEARLSKSQAKPGAKPTTISKPLPLDAPATKPITTMAAPVVSKFGLDKIKPDVTDKAPAPAKGLPGKREGFTVSPDELDYQTAYDAHRGSSHVPEQRAKQEQRGFVRHMEDIQKTLTILIDRVRPEDKTELLPILDGVLARYKDSYLKKYTGYLNAKSKTISPMITGGSNFPTRKNQKALDREQKVNKDLQSWEAWALKDAKKQLGLLKQPISSDDPEAIKKLQEKLSKLDATHQQMKAINKLVRNKKLSDADKIKFMVDLGVSEKAAKEALKPDFAGRLGIPAYAITNSNANMKNIKKRIADLKSKSTDETTDTKFDGGTLSDNAEDNRVQIFFDDKPNDATISSLKKRGFKWAPSVGAWQRKRTKSALYDAQNIIGIVEPEPPEVKEGYSISTEEQKLRASIAEGETILKGKVPHAKRQAIEKQVEKGKKNLRVLTPEPEITGEKDKTVKVPMSDYAKANITPKEQKAFLLEEIDTAIEEAPDTGGIAGEKVYEKHPKITIKVPGDGEFTLLNNKTSLQEFKKRSKSFPGAPPPNVKPPRGQGMGPATISQRPTGKRVVDFPGEYTREYSPRKVTALIERPKDDKNSGFYERGFFSNGAYLVSIPKPKTKRPIKEAEGLFDKILDEVSKDLTPAKIGLEEYRNPSGDKEDTQLFTFVSAGDMAHTYDPRLLDIIFKHHPKSKPFMNKEGVLYFKDGKKIVGIAMFNDNIHGDIEGLKKKNAVKRETPSGYASTGSFADIPISAMEMPEIAKLAKELMQGKHPRVKAMIGRKMSVRGRFTGSGAGKIELRADLFSTPEQAMKTLAHEIGHLVDWLDDKTLARGNILGRIASLKKYMKRTMERKPVAAGPLTRWEDIQKELKDFTQKWKPFDPNEDAKFTKYRFSSPELYADALSALITNPGYLQENAPQFFRAFYEFLENKPMVKNIYANIMGQVNKTNTAKAKAHIDDVYKMFQESTEKRNKAVKESRLPPVSVFDQFSTGLWDQAHTALKAIRKMEKMPGQVGADAEKARMAIQELQHTAAVTGVYLSDFNQAVLKPLQDAGFNLEDLGVVGFYERIAKGDRGDKANPLGMDKSVAQRDLSIIGKEIWGPEKFKTIKDALGAYRKLREQELYPIIRESAILKPKLMDHIEQNTHHVKWDVAVFFDAETGGNGGGARVYKQIGTMSDIDNPIVSTVLQDVSLLRASLINMVKQDLVVALKHAGIIEPAELRYSLDKKGLIPKKPGRGKGLLTLFEKDNPGKAKHYVVDKSIAEMFEYQDIEAYAIYSLWFNVSRIAKELMVGKNPAWMARNLDRDFKGTIKNIPRLRLRHIPELIKSFGKVLPEVIEESYRRVPSTRIRAMKKSRGLPQYRIWSSKDVQFDDEIMRQLTEFRVLPDSDSRSRMVPNKIKKIWDFMEQTAYASEIWSKVAADRFLEGRVPEQRKRARITRELAGTPDSKQRGKYHRITNSIAMFSSMRMAGLRQMNKAFQQDKAGYVWKTGMINTVSKIATYLLLGNGAALGLKMIDEITETDSKTKQKVKDHMNELSMAYDRIPSYDIDHYTVIPLGLTDQGKAAYLRLPMDYEGQTFGAIGYLSAKGIIDQAIGSGDLPDIYKRLVKTVSDQNPYNWHPLITSVWDMGKYVSGGAPKDWKGYDVIPKRVQATGGETYVKESMPYMMKHLLSNFGVRNFVDLGRGGLEVDRQWYEKLLAQPGLNAIGSYLRFSDRGLDEKIRRDWDKVRQAKAEINLAAYKAVVKLANKDSPSGEDFVEALMQPGVTKKKLITAFGRSSADFYTRMLHKATSKTEKIIVIAKMLEEREKKNDKKK